MAADSVIEAVLERIESVSGSTFTAYFDEAPMNNAVGNVPPIPIVILKDQGTTPEYTLEFDVLELTNFTVDVFATASTLETVVRLIKYGSGAYNAVQGLDNCILTVTGQECLMVQRRSEQRFQEASRLGDGKLAYRCTLGYSVQTNVTA